MRCIVLLTDWGNKSYYVGVVKGVIHQINPEAKIIDLTHEVEPYSVREAMHVLFRAYRDFPPGSIFLCVVDYGVGTERKAIAVETESGFIFVGPDNGIFTLIATEEGIKKAVELNNPRYFYVPHPSFTFHGRDIFAPVSAHLSRGVTLEALGTPLKEIVLLPYTRAQIREGEIQGEIVFFDRFGNLETNIPATMAEEAGLAGSEVVLTLGLREYPLRYTLTYGTEEKGTLTVHPDSSGFLEIAVTQGNACRTLRVQAGAAITLRKASQKRPPEHNTLP